MPEVQIILGSKSDLPVAEKAVDVLKKLKISYDVTVASAHRTPKRVEEIVKESDASVFIAIAGLSAALPGSVAAFTVKPVIGVPVSGKVNLDSVLSIVQMPPGIPVACVGLDRGDNAAILAAEMIAVNDEETEKNLLKYRNEMSKKVVDDSKGIDL